MKNLLSAFAMAAALTAGALAAHADLPPPDGQKFVGYGFKVEGLAKFPDRVIVVYPWSTSNGAPTREITTAADGQKVSVGRRSAPPILYAVKRDAWDAFSAKLKPEEDPPEAEVKAFLAQSGVQCSKQPSMKGVLPSSDPRDEIVDTFTVATIDDKTCDFGGDAKAAPSDGSGKPEATANGVPEAKDGAPPKGGCAGCTTASNEGASAGWAAGAFLAGLVLTRRRGRR